METASGMKIRLNGEEYSTGASNVTELLREMNIEPARVAVEINLNIIKKELYDSTAINEGDEVEVVSFVGGGRV